MSNDEKYRYINNYLKKLIRLAEKSFENKQYNLCLASLDACCDIQYSINQCYTDQHIEDLISRISNSLVDIPDNFQNSRNTVLFYDGFGLDSRGWAASFAKALADTGYNIIYVAPNYSRDRIPHIVYEIERGGGIVEYIDMSESYLHWVSTLNELFNKYKPCTAFFYTIPNDVAGAAVFDAYKGLVNRIQIDLTDHAFWVGVNAFDFCTESRNIGLSNAIYHRGIPFEKIIKMDGCPYIDRTIIADPFPFDIESDQYIFSGGSLYKTLGDENMYYYKIVDHILSTHPLIKYIYAGSGDDSEIKKIIKKYPDRAFHIMERPDFIRLFENCLFYLNTYPMFGGLMMRYAAMSGKIPLTLRHGSDHEGVLFDQEKREIEYESYDDIIIEADRLILDPEYREKKEKDLAGSVITEDEFLQLIKKIIAGECIGDSFQMISPLDTSRFQEEYLTRTDPQELVQSLIPKKRNKELFKYFPLLFFNKIIRRNKYDKF